MHVPALPRRDNMRLRAPVRRATGKAHHFLAHLDGDEVVKDAQLGPVAWVEIQHQKNGTFHLNYLDASGAYLTDTWHPTLEEAKDQARFEFEIDDRDWVEVTDGSKA
jgi:hypothetical protein